MSLRHAGGAEVRMVSSARRWFRSGPCSATDTKTATTAQELCAELPLEAARLRGRLRGNRAVRTDYTLLGIAALPADSTFTVGKREGPGCGRATPIVSKIALHSS